MDADGGVDGGAQARKRAKVAPKKVEGKEAKSPPPPAEKVLGQTGNLVANKMNEKATRAALVLLTEQTDLPLADLDGKGLPEMRELLKTHQTRLFAAAARIARGERNATERLDLLKKTLEFEGSYWCTSEGIVALVQPIDARRITSSEFERRLSPRDRSARLSRRPGTRVDMRGMPPVMAAAVRELGLPAPVELGEEPEVPALGVSDTDGVELLLGTPLRAAPQAGPALMQELRGRSTADREKLLASRRRVVTTLSGRSAVIVSASEGVLVSSVTAASARDRGANAAASAQMPELREELGRLYQQLGDTAKDRLLLSMQQACEYFCSSDNGSCMLKT